VSDETIFFVSRRYPDGGVAVAPATILLQRISIWEGASPAISPARNALASVVGDGWAQEKRVWLETRPVGCLLSDLGGLEALEFAVLFEEVLEALVALEAVGLAHGNLTTHRVLVSELGRPILIGRTGGDASDYQGVLALMESYWLEERGSLFDVIPKDLNGLWRAIQSLLGEHASEPVHRELARKVRLKCQPVSVDSEQIAVALESPSERFDEVSVDLGPEPRSRSAFGGWSATGASDSGLTGFSDSSREWTIANEAQQLGAHQSLLAQVLAVDGQPRDIDRFKGQEAKIAKKVRAEIANEALSPLLWFGAARGSQVDSAPLTPQSKQSGRRVWLVYALVAVILSAFYFLR